MSSSQQVPGAPGQVPLPHEGGGPKEDTGRHSFEFTYDDTGAITTVLVPNGWTLQRVVDEAYASLGEPVHAEDRVEFGGRLLGVFERALKVKEYVAAGYARNLHIVSRPGGAGSCCARRVARA